MTVTHLLLSASIILLLTTVALLITLLRRVRQPGAVDISPRLDAFEKNLERIERALRDEVAHSRDELNGATRQQRQELNQAFETFSGLIAQRMRDATLAQQGQLGAFSDQLGGFTQSNGARLDSIRLESTRDARRLRQEVLATLNGIDERMAGSMRDLGADEKAQLEAMSSAISRLSEVNEKRLGEIRTTVAQQLQAMQTDNAAQLEKMRETVDEKLQGTLEKRLGESFKQVSDRLEMVHKGLGEMQALATGVGDLKKVLTNVKTRGTWGEVQLGALLEQVLTPDQYGTNVATKNTRQRVEFAIKLPGQGVDQNDTVWLPIDAKFPVEDYQRLMDAQERGDSAGVEASGKQLERRVMACARDICNKYLDPPHTTDFAILFLPIEGLFAEVIRRGGLTQTVQRECRVVIAGPTTLWSILNSLQMGFRTLAIQERSSEVWNLLGAVKTEWTKYGDVLDAVQKKLNQASNTIEKAKVRSRAVGRKLRDVQELPVGDAAALLPFDTSGERMAQADNGGNGRE